MNRKAIKILKDIDAYVLKTGKKIVHVYPEDFKNLEGYPMVSVLKPNYSYLYKGNVEIKLAGLN